MSSSERITRTKGWGIVELPSRYPWFRDELIHPERFARAYKGPKLGNRLFDFLSGS
jgi:hypothetical protein